jgi:hypothetical protein
MLPTKNEITLRVHDLLKELVDFAQAEYDLNVRDINFNLGFRDCSRLGVAGCEADGRPSMKLNVGALLKSTPIAFVEFKSFNRNSQIGGFDTTDWKLWVDTLVVHEFAHVLQYAFNNRPNNRKKDSYRYNRTLTKKHSFIEGFGYFEPNHGDFFKRIYLMLRKRWINDRAVGVGRPSNVSHFNAAERPSRYELKLDNTHPYVGRTIEYMNSTYTIVAYKASNRKYPLIGVNSRNHRVKFPLILLK